MSISIEQSGSVYCNRTLNMRSIGAIGYDMDYTLVHYDIEAWEEMAFRFLKKRLLKRGWPIEGASFDKNFAIRGLVIDKLNGNLLKPNRFGYIKKASHGLRFLTYQEQRALYSNTVVDLTEDRWIFMSTFFSLSLANMLAHAVELFDQGKLPKLRDYADIHCALQEVLDEIHQDGLLKEEVMNSPQGLVVRDPNLVPLLQEQRLCGKKLALITNSEWGYTNAMMQYACEPYLQQGSWRELFDLVVVSAQKPAFFTERQPLFEVVDESGLLRPARSIQPNRLAYLGGHVGLVEEFLGISGDDILYVGDHIYSDVHVSKKMQRWRTALVLRELEGEVAAVRAFAKQQTELNHLMGEKAALERAINHEKLSALKEARNENLDLLESKLAELNTHIAPLAKASSSSGNLNWGLLMRTGNDKSHLARQVERHADIYFAKVSDLRPDTPFHLYRSHRGDLPHDSSQRVTSPVTPQNA